MVIISELEIDPNQGNELFKMFDENPYSKTNKHCLPILILHEYLVQILNFNIHYGEEILKIREKERKVWVLDTEAIADSAAINP